MGDEITAQVMAGFGWDYVNVQGEFGEDGQSITYLVKGAPQLGVNGHAYQGTLIETQPITRLAKAAGKTYGVAALTVTHGETDCGDTSYETQLYGLLQNYDTDIAAITGQTQNILMILSQQNSLLDRRWMVGFRRSKRESHGIALRFARRAAGVRRAASEFVYDW